MAEIKLADFGIGIDTRRSASTSNPKSFRDIENCFVTNGRTIKKRGGFKHVANLPPASSGLFAINNELHTFMVSRAAALYGNPSNVGITPHVNPLPTMVNGATVPIVVDTIEQTQLVGTSKKIDAENIYGFDARRIHFAESFNTFPYIIVEHWNGETTHHYIAGQKLGDIVRTWSVTTGASDAFLKPTDFISAPFVFKIHGSNSKLATEPYWGLKDFAKRGFEKASVLERQSSADFSISNAKIGVLDPYVSPLFLAFHNGGTYLGTVYTGIEGIFQAGKSLPNLPKDTEVDAGGIVRTFAENKLAQEKYLSAFYHLQSELNKMVFASSSSAATAGNVTDAHLTQLLSGRHTLEIAIANAPTTALKDALRQQLSTLDADILAYSATINADGSHDTSIEAAIALCQWKVHSYMASLAADLSINAPAVAVGDYVWVNRNSVINWNTFVVTINPYTLLNPLDSYAVALNPDSLGYTNIKDKALNQNSRIALNIASKLFVADGDAVRFSQTGNATIWEYNNDDATLDTGWIPTGNHQSGDKVITGLYQHMGKLAASFSDSMQIWTVDPDPQLMSFDQGLSDFGTRFKHSFGSVGNDTVLLHDSGFRSLSTMQYNNNVIGNDFGTVVDSLVKAHVKGVSSRADILFSTAPAVINLATANEIPVVSKTISSLGQYWCAIGKDVWVFAYSRSASIAGWSRYTLPFEVDYIEELNGTVYIRSQNKLYAYDEAKLEDDIDGIVGTTAPILGSALFQFLNAKAAGRMKMFHSYDSIILGNANMRFKYDVRDLSIESADLPLNGDSNPDYLTPMQLSGTHIAPVVSSLEQFELEYLALYYNMLGRR